MKRSTRWPPSRALLCATGEADEPKGPARGVRLPEFIDHIVEGRTTPTLTRAAVIIDLIRKGLRYERLRQTKGDPALSELVAMMDEMLATRLTKATAQIYRHVSFECLLLMKLLEEVLNDARVSSREAERLLTGRVLTPPQGAPGCEPEDFLRECQKEAVTADAEIQEEWQNEMARALGVRPAPDAGPFPEHWPSPSAGQLSAPAPAPPDAAAR